MKEAIEDALHRWNDYSGRSTRSQYWWAFLAIIIWPFLISLTTLGLVSILNPSSLSKLVVLLQPLLSLLCLPFAISVSVRRMHDVGKSGWFALVPIYSIYLFVQPSIEKGRIPIWLLAEKTALVFSGLASISVLTDGIGQAAGPIFWLCVFIGIRIRNNRSSKQ